MRAIIDKLEREYGVSVLFACYAGSQSYGLYTEQSDLDIRVIYKSLSLRQYVNLIDHSNVITLIDKNLDVQGWDVMKTLHLFHKSNPSLFEWLRSPFIYYEKGSLRTNLNYLLDEFYSRRAIAHHYFKLSVRNLNEIAKNNGNEKKRLKLFIQVARAVQLLKVIIKGVPLSQIDINVFKLNQWMDPILQQYFHELFVAKINNTKWNNSDDLFLILEKELSSMELQLECLPVGKNSLSKLNDLLWNELQISGGEGN